MDVNYSFQGTKNSLIAKKILRAKTIVVPPRLNELPLVSGKHSLSDQCLIGVSKK